MADSDQNLLPGRVIKRALQIGVDALIATPALVTRILETDLEDSAELAKAVAYWAAHPPTVVQGYTQGNAVFPRIVVTLSADRNMRDLIGLGEQAWLDQSDDVQGTEFRVRMMAVFTIFIMAEHSDVTMWYYRIARRILNVASSPGGYFVARGLEEPKLDGNDLIPDPQYTPENIYVRQLTLAIEYWDTWTDQDALWTALNGTGYQAGPTTVNVAHEDSSGGIQPYEEG